MTKKELQDFIEKHSVGKYSFGRKPIQQGKILHADFTPQGLFATWRLLNSVHKGGLGISPLNNYHIHIDDGVKRRFIEYKHPGEKNVRSFRI